MLAPSHKKGGTSILVGISSEIARKSGKSSSATWLNIVRRAGLQARYGRGTELLRCVVEGSGNDRKRRLMLQAKVTLSSEVARNAKIQWAYSLLVSESSCFDKVALFTQ